MICLLIVDGSESLREIMGLLIREEHDMRISAFASTREEALAQLGNCDAVLVSAHMPHGSARAVISAIAGAQTETKILAIDVPDDKAAVAAYVAAGAASCILEEDSVDELLRRVRSLCAERGNIAAGA